MSKIDISGCDLSPDENDLLVALGNIANFLKITECTLQDASTDYIINSFKLAKFVEDAFLAAEKESSLEEFCELIECFLYKDTKSHLDWYLCRNALSTLLKKYFTTATKSCEIPVRMFLAFKSEQDLQKVITDLLKEVQSNAAIGTFLSNNRELIDWEALNLDLLINKLNKQMIIGCSENVDKFIDNMLRLYKLEKNIVTLLQIVNHSKVAESVRQLIFSKLEPKMLERGAQSQKFWLTFLKYENTNLIIGASKHDAHFLELYMNFIVFLVSMFNYENEVWLLDSSSICNSVTYIEVCQILMRFLNVENYSISNYCKQRICEAKDCVGTEIWSVLVNKLINCHNAA